MELKINDNFSLNIYGDNNCQLNIDTITIKDREYKNSLYSDAGSFQHFIKERLKNQIHVDYQFFLHENMYNTKFYKDKVYPYFNSSKFTMSIDTIAKRSIQIDFSKILDGLVTIINSDYTKNKIDYDLLIDTFSQNTLDFANDHNRCWDYTDKWLLLAIEQHKNMLSPYRYRELNKVLDFFKDKKTVWLMYSDGTKKQIDYNLSLRKLVDEEKEIRALKHGSKYCNINHRLIKTTLTPN